MKVGLSWGVKQSWFVEAICQQNEEICVCETFLVFIEGFHDITREYFQKGVQF